MRKLNLFVMFIAIVTCSADEGEVAVGDTLVKVEKNLKDQNTSKVVKPKEMTTYLNPKEVFVTSPIIYSLLCLMSIISLSILLFTLVTFRSKDLISKRTINDLRHFLSKGDYESAIGYCNAKDCLLSSMITTGIEAREHGAQYMIEAIKEEGKRRTSSFWQRISILSDITVIAPMLGLLGTVIGMFYAFYDINRSIDSLSALFDGLGIAVGTTVAGLIVAIISMIFYAILKFRMIKALNIVEREAVALGNLIKNER